MENSLAMVLAKLLAAFPMPAEGSDSIKLRLAAYLEALSGFPVWAVEVARVKVTRGLVPDLNRSFAPTPPEFAEIIRGVVASQAKPDDGVTSFGGDVPMTWILGDDPRFARLRDMRLDKRPGSKPAYAMESKHAEGKGWFFPTAYLDELGAG